MTTADSARNAHAQPVSDTSARDLEANAVYRKVLWRIMPFLMLCYIVAFIDRANIGFAKLHFVTDLGFNDAIYGIGAGIFYVGYILFEVPSNMVLHKNGVRQTLLRIMLLWGVFSAGMAFMQTSTHFYVMRFLLGAAEAGMFPGMLLYLTYWVPLNRRARFNALFTASIPLAGMLGGPLSGWLMHTFEGVAGMKGWQWMFIIEGLPACALGLVAYFYLQDGPAFAKWLTPAQKNIITEDLAKSVSVKKNGGEHSYMDAMPPLAVRAIREVVQQGQDAPLESALLLERKAFQLLFATQDQQEGMRAFLEKRTPQFQGA